MTFSFLISGVFLFFLYFYFPVLTSIISVGIILFLVRNKKFIALFFLLSGIIYPLLRYEDLETQSFPDEISAEVIFSSPEASLKGGYNYRLFIRNCYSGTCPSKIRLHLDSYIQSGTIADIVMKLKLKRHSLVPGLYERSYYIARPVSIKIKGNSRNIRAIIERQRSRLNEVFDRSFNRKAADLSKALITGSKDIDPGLRECFRKTGLSHLLTVSGTHFGLLFFLIFILIKRIIYILPYQCFHKLTTYVSINLISGLLVIPFLFLYLLISGMNIPAIRAFIMAILFVFSLMAGRRYYWLTGLLIAAVVILIIEPSSLFDISFLLSFSAVFLIGLWLERFRRNEGQEQEKGLIKRFLKPFINTFSISLAATLGTLPLVMYCFHYVSLIGIFVNIVVTPFVCLIILPLLLSFSFFYLFTGYIFMKDLIENTINLALRCVEIFSSFKYADIAVLPFPLIILPLLYLLLLFFLISDRFRYIYLAFFMLAIFTISTRTDKTTQVTFLDVNQGDSSVIELSDGKVIVIDTGREGIETSAYLKYRGKRTIDALVITHPHPDHAGGIRYLKDNFQIKEVWHNGLLIYEDNELSNITRRSLSRGDHLKGNGYGFIVLHPYEGFSILSQNRYSFENNSSLVMKFISGRYSVLFTGDIEEPAEEDMLGLGNTLRSDVLKVPHHGSKYSALPEFLNLISPGIAVISAGAQNPYGHPHIELLRLLRDSRTYLTSRDGSIKIILSEGLYVKIYKDYRLRKSTCLKDEWSNIKNLFKTF